MRRVFCFGLCVLALGPLALPLRAQSVQTDQSAADTPSTSDSSSGSAAPSGAGSDSASSAESAAASPDSASTDSSDLVQKTVALDIATASFYELADWLASLGLPVTGNAAEMRAALYKAYGVSAPKINTNGRTITIEKAGSAEYFKVDSDSDSLMRITGGVVLTFRDENKSETHRLEAAEVIYDKAHNSVSAVGHVKYRRERSGTVEEFSGETITVNLDDWTGVFLDGKMRTTTGTSSSSSSSSSSASSSSSSSSSSGSETFYFSADTILKRSGDVIILENGIITSCSAEHPHYSIRAKKIWLLGGSEWAIADAVLSIGEVPILWLPFFFYPGQEIIFHPVFGYRARVGTFVQTTTYLIGQKKASTQTGIMSIGSSSDGPKEVHGLFLRDAAAGKTAETTKTLKLLADIYANLGFFMGLDGSASELGPFTDLSLESGIARSRSVFYLSSSYSPYSSAGAYQSVWNDSDFLGIELPLRFGFDFSTGLKLGPVNITAAFPIYSDPYFKKDFRWRSEDQNLLSSLSSSSSSTATSEPSTITTLTQKLNLAFSLSPKFSPWLSSISVSKLTSSLTWQTLATTASKLGEGTTLYNVDPRRYFFYPDVFRPLDVSFSLSGGNSSSDSGKTDKDAAAKSGDLDLRSPWEDEQSDTGRTDSPASALNAENGGFRLPARAPGLSSPDSSSSSGLKLSWSISPSGYIEDRLKSSGWTLPSDITFEDPLYLLYSYSVSGAFKASYASSNNAFSAGLGLSLLSQARLRDSTTDSGYSSRVLAYDLSDAQYRQDKISSSLSAAVKPLTGSWMFGDSSLSYNLEYIMYNYLYSSYKSNSSGSYDYTYDWRIFDWDTNSVTAHTATAMLAVKTGQKTQSFGLTMSLPPTTEAYTPAITLNAGKGDFSLTATAKQRYYRSSSSNFLDFSEFSADAATGSLSIGLPYGLTLSDSIAYDTDNQYWTSNVAKLTWGPLSMTLNAARSYYYTYENGSGWTASSNKEFQLTNFQTALTQSLSAPKNWPFTSTVKGSLSLTQSFLEFSDSILAFNLSFSFKMTDFLEITFSSSSQNSAAWRYCPWLFSGASLITGSADDFFKNPVTDILEGFYFWDDDARRDSLFKLKSLSFKIQHYMHDWNLSFEIAASPSLDTTTTPYTYVVDPTFTLLLSWNDLSQIKASVVKSSDGYTFN